MTQVSLSEGATTQQTLATVKEVEDDLLNEEGAAVESTFASLGFGGSGQNSAMIFVKLRDFEERQDDPSLSAASVAGRANLRFATHRAGRVMFMQPPAIPGMGNTGGFTIYFVDQAGNGSDALKTAAEQLVATARQNPGVKQRRRPRHRRGQRPAHRHRQREGRELRRLALGGEQYAVGDLRGLRGQRLRARLVAAAGHRAGGARASGAPGTP